MAMIARRRAPARRSVQGGPVARTNVPTQPVPFSGRPRSGGAERRPWRRRSSVTMRLASLPRSLLALTAFPPRHGRCRYWVRTLGRDSDRDCFVHLPLLFPCLKRRYTRLERPEQESSMPNNFFRSLALVGA